MAKDPRLSMATLKVLGALMEHGANEFSGAEISKKTGQPSGTLYPILTRLEAAGWLASRWEDGEPSAMGRPRRRLYKVTTVGRVKAQCVGATVRADLGGLAWA
ncbi:PadR family transcriptional regulator [Brevundimonas sp.]|uniref:PadR family transcriptional regulator n=1 Tax=Brevundimonas sp. TaxID=1871086 RepID=UPI0025BA53B6|nr:helix-turn-helix transcriptional regulator [Brevundimonas sp.]MCG2663212.1 helix-turn-helix transcriptional regulator [Brevundimonas sp.]